MPALTAQDIASIEKATSGTTLRGKAIAKLYLANGNVWGYTGLVGGLVIVADTNKKTYFLRLIEVKSKTIAWEHEIYDNFEYRKSVDHFHVFEGDDHVVGLCFSDVKEATEFYAAVMYCKNSPINTTGKKKEKTENKGEKKKKKGFFGSLFKKKKEPEIVLSGPRNFQHKGHVGWSEEGGFEIRDIPPELKQIFREAGIKKKDMKNEETAKLVMGIVNDHMKDVEAESGTAPPPPPVTGGPPPPPPPTVTGGPPPPPPPGLKGPPPPPTPNTHNTEDSSQVESQDSRGDLLSQIRGGTSLKPVDNASRPDVSQMPKKQTKNLVDTLASAMAMRRNDMLYEQENDDDGDDDDWSD